MHHSARWALLCLTQELHPQLTCPSERGFSTWCSRSLCFQPCRETSANPAKNPAEVNVSRQSGFPWGNWGVTALSSQGCQGGNDLQPSSRWEAKAATCAAKFTRAHLSTWSHGLGISGNLPLTEGKSSKGHDFRLLLILFHFQRQQD